MPANSPAGNKVFRDGLAGGHFCTLPDGKPVRAPAWPGACAFPHFTNAATRVWWGKLYGRLSDAGVAGYWHDTNEPAAFAAQGDNTLPLVTRHYFEGRQGDHREAHNVYGLLQMQAAYEGLRERQPERRPFMVTRAGWAGMQRYAWTGTGDTSSTWEALRQTIATVLGLGLSGVAYTGPDIGGFAGAPSGELLVRWFQMATFLPFFRGHSAIHTPRREPWSFGEPYLSILRESLRLRERLLPYLYSLCWEAAQTGAPLVRPLWWPDAGDPAFWDVDDAFLLGDDLLVAPVLEPGATARQVLLPKGHWYTFGDDDSSPATGRAECAAPLARLPVLVRAGSILPLVEAGRLVLHIYAPLAGEGGGRLYSDGAMATARGDWTASPCGGTRKGSPWRGKPRANSPFPTLRSRYAPTASRQVKYSRTADCCLSQGSVLRWAGFASCASRQHKREVQQQGEPTVQQRQQQGLRPRIDGPADGRRGRRPSLPRAALPGGRTGGYNSGHGGERRRCRSRGSPRL